MTLKENELLLVNSISGWNPGVGWWWSLPVGWTKRRRLCEGWSKNKRKRISIVKSNNPEYWVINKSSIQRKHGGHVHFPSSRWWWFLCQFCSISIDFHWFLFVLSFSIRLLWWSSFFNHRHQGDQNRCYGDPRLKIEKKTTSKRALT